MGDSDDRSWDNWSSTVPLSPLSHDNDALSSSCAYDLTMRMCAQSIYPIPLGNRYLAYHFAFFCSISGNFIQIIIFFLVQN